MPIYVWQPAPITCPRDAKIAIAPVAGRADIAARVENAFIGQRPEVRSDLRLITAQQLFESSPIRLVSTASFHNDAMVIQAAQKTAADILIEGEVLSANLRDPLQPPPRNPEDAPSEQLLIAWRIIDVSSAKSVSNQIVSIDTERADRDYPELIWTHPDSTERLIVASAKDSWKGLAPSVTKVDVGLMVPWLQVGAMKVRTGIVDAQKGRWDMAEEKFAIAARRNPFNIAAHHNLAISQVAREDFSGARKQLSDVSWPFSTRLPAETRFWLDQRYRQYQMAHGLGKPPEGWLFPDPVESSDFTAVKPTRIEDLPWWTAIPFVKPPGWTWGAWLSQPWLL